MTHALDQLCINTLRFLAVDMVEKADSGHPGLPLGAAPMAYVLWQEVLRHNPADPHWANRDRFVLSAGHGSALLYSLLHMCGYPLSLHDLQQFRQWGSLTPGHPERDIDRGIEVTTGPLGQGMANAVGMAIAEAQLAARYNRPEHALIDHRTFALVSDGDLMEGVSAEAASLAGHLKLGKLICLYDDNRVTLAAGTPITFSEDRAARFAAYDWHIARVEDGNDLPAIRMALAEACALSDKPSLILVRSQIGYGSPEQGSFKAHGSPLGASDTARTKATLGWPAQPPFHVPEEAMQHFREALPRGAQRQHQWQEALSAYGKAFPALAEELQRSLRGELGSNWQAALPTFASGDKGIATRKAGGDVLAAVAAKLPSLSGGSADLDPSTFTALHGLGDFNPPTASDHQGSDGGGWSYQGRNLHFGVREHAMGAIAVGMAAHGAMLPYTATFLVFSDYMRPPIRLAALSHLQVVFVFTHDSIGLGEDGPTHQPVEHLAALRAIPRLNVIRPADANETTVAWQVALETRDAPSALVLSRQALPVIDRNQCAAASGLRQGAYVLRDSAATSPRLLLIGTGSEVALVLQAAEELERRGVATRVVSMPCWRLFDAQPQHYRDSVFPPSIRARLAVEAGCGMGWHRYVGDAGDVLGVERFGASAPGLEVLDKYGFNVDNVVKRALALLPKADDVQVEEIR